MSDKKQWQPGDDATSDLELNVIDAEGNILGEITVEAGNRVPPTRIEGATGYEEK